MTQAKLAEKAGLSIDSISRIERGERAPSFESLKRIARVLGVEQVELLNLQGKELEPLTEGPLKNFGIVESVEAQETDQIRKPVGIAKILMG